MSEINIDELNNTVKTLGWYFNEKTTPTGLFSTIGRIDEKLGSLDATLKKADESSTKLTQAINKITLAGVVVASLTLLVAVGNLILDAIQLLK